MTEGQTYTIAWLGELTQLLRIPLTLSSNQSVMTPTSLRSTLVRTCLHHMNFISPSLTSRRAGDMHWPTSWLIRHGRLVSSTF